jgi:glutathione transport system ATP-binding protein
MPLLSVSDLTVTFDDFTAIDSVGFAIDAGETLAVVGESGSGKSVTALSIMRLVELGTRARITSGRIDFEMADGSVVDLWTLSEPQMQGIRGNDISMIFQEPLTSLNPVYPVGEQIAEALRIHEGINKKASLARARDMFDLVRIPEAEKRIGQYPHEMSGGMRQRIMIAIALCCGPRLLIADEPTTALDVTIQAQMLITHDMGVVAEVADRVVVMNKARVVEQGDVDQIFHSPQDPYTQALLSAVPRLGSTAGKDAPEPFHLAGSLE